MMFSGALRRSDPAGAEEDGALFAAIGDFLRDQRLSPSPVNYAFAHAVVADPDGALARAVSGLTDGGVRLTRAQVKDLGATVEAGASRSAAPEAPDMAQRADGQAARAQMQVEGFADMVAAMQAETAGFGRDLAASADAMRAGHSAEPAAVARLGTITDAMLARVHHAENRLVQANREAQLLRAELAEARGDARRDPLTGLPNRRALEEAFAAARLPAHLALCDVDHFKAVNDRWGHEVGDRVLKAIGAALRQHADDGLVARYGGEEFAVLFTGDAQDAHGTLQAMHAAVRRRRFRLRESDADVGAISFSAGLVRVLDGEGFADACRRADALLYQAKKAGRDRIVGENC